MNNYEKLIEFIINEDEKSARELFHRIVVEKSRSIYESLMDDEEEIGGSEVDSLIDEISADEEGIAEDDEEGVDIDLDDEATMGDEFPVDGEEEHDFDASGDLDPHEEEHVEDEDRIRDLEDAFAELQAEFDEILAKQGDDTDGEDETEQEPEGMDDEEVSDLDAEDETLGEAEEEGDEYGWDVEPEKEKSSRKIAGKSYGGSASDEKSQDSTDLMREYIEKIGNIYGGKGDASEGDEVAAGKSVAVNKGSVVAGKNDMGGTTANIAKGKSEANPDNKQYSKPTNQYSKGQGEIKSGNINVPGGKAGTAFKTKQTAKVSESKTKAAVKRTPRKA